MASNADTFVVKLTFDGQLRRFPVAKGTTFLALHGQVVSMLGRAPEADIVLKYTDEEGDLITITSDLELNSALVPGQLLRLTAIEKKANVGYPPLDAPMTDASSLALAPGAVPDASAPVQGADVFRGFAYGCGRGMAGMDGSPQHAPFGPHRGAFGPRGGFGGFGWRGRGGHRGGFGPHGPHPHGPHHGGPHHGPHHHGPHPYDHPFFRRGDMTPEEWHKAKKEHHKEHKEHKHAHKEAHKHMKKEWKAAHKYMKKEIKENGFPPGFETMGGMPWSFAPGCGDRLVARYAKDLTIPDGSQIAPNTAFVKTWRLRNEGAEWPAGCVLKFLGKHSDGLGAPEAVVIPGPVAPDTEVDVSVNLIAPEKPGRYSGYWKLCTPEGKKFGQRVWVSIVVPSPNNNSSSSDEDKEADRYESMVDTVLAMGFNVKRHRIFRMLQKTDGDISLVCERLSHKQEKQARKEMKKGMKLC